MLSNWDPDKDNLPKFDSRENLSYLYVGNSKDLTIRELATKIAKKTKFQGNIICDQSKADDTPKKVIHLKDNKLGMGFSN